MGKEPEGDLAPRMPGLTDIGYTTLKRIQGWLDTGRDLESYWVHKGEEHRSIYEPIWKKFKEYESKTTKPVLAPPETWLTRRRSYMERRYTKTPESGFSGALGGAAVQRKKLLGT